MLQPPSSAGDSVDAEQRQADALVGDVGRQMAADEGDVEAADEVADHQQHVAALAERLATAPRATSASPPALLGGGDLLAVVQADRQQHDQHGERRQRPHGRPPVAEIALQHGRQRHDEELAERAAGRADADRQRRLRRRRHAQDHAQHRPEGRGRQADADQDVAQDQHGAVMHGGGHDHAQHVEHAAAGDGRCRAEAVAQPAGEAARRRPSAASTAAVPKENSSRPTCSSAETGFRKMPKLWRTPRPMVRTRKPHHTAVQ